MQYSQYFLTVKNTWCLKIEITLYILHELVLGFVNPTHQSRPVWAPRPHLSADSEVLNPYNVTENFSNYWFSYSKFVLILGFFTLLEFQNTNTLAITGNKYKNVRVPRVYIQ